MLVKYSIDDRRNSFSNIWLENLFLANLCSVGEKKILKEVLLLDLNENKTKYVFYFLFRANVYKV